MPLALSNDFDAPRFAALMGRFDTSNPSEAEAMNAARAMRRMAAERNMRIVDIIGRTDVMQALDVQLKPLREESEELKAAFLEIAKYAELAREQAEAVQELRRQMAGSPRVARSAGLVDGRLMTCTILMAIALMIAAEWSRV